MHYLLGQNYLVRLTLGRRYSFLPLSSSQLHRHFLLLLPPPPPLLLRFRLPLLLHHLSLSSLSSSSCSCCSCCSSEVFLPHSGSLFSSGYG
ncbi:ORF30 [White spot syndrome virus]|uniref:ORF30 n=1 Tax=White spot syndrome virus TaxID=342409 RepID=A0A2D3I5Q7_9VIRU|nr:ORF30 [White spot syndrome virus]